MRLNIERQQNGKHGDAMFVRSLAASHTTVQFPRETVTAASLQNYGKVHRSVRIHVLTHTNEDIREFMKLKEAPAPP